MDYCCDFSDLIEDSESQNLTQKSETNEDLMRKACALWEENIARGMGFQTIYESFKKRRSFKKLLNFVNSLSANLNAEKLFAIFILWALEHKADTERQTLRPARFEIREISKEEIEEINSKLEEWKDS